MVTISISFVLPIRMNDKAVSDDNKLELSSQNEYIRINYESVYSKMSRIKTIVILN